MTGIYQISSVLNPDKIYIGSAVNINSRKSLHLHLLRKNKHINKKLQNHFNKYGEADLEFTILIQCNKAELINNEQTYITNNKPWFNICNKAGSILGFKLSEEAKEKIRQSHIGKVISEETKLKIRNSQLGALSHRYGKTHTEETLKKMSKPRRKRLGI